MKWLILVSLLCLLPDEPGAGWELRRDRDGIQVFTKATEGSKLKDSWVQSTFKGVTVEQVAAVVLNADDFTKWLGDCKESWVVERVSQDEFIYYSRFRAPIVRDRDMVVHVKVYREPGMIRIEQEGRPDRLAEKEKLVRIRDFRATWIIEERIPGEVFAINHYHVHPGGKIPDWLANSASVDNPFKNFRSLREMLGIDG